MIVQSDFIHHWKTKALAARIGNEAALLALLALWGYCEKRKLWEMQLTPIKLAGICNYTGPQAENLLASMVEIGFLDVTEEQTEDGTLVLWYEVHEWGEINSGLVHNWWAAKGKTASGWHKRGHLITKVKTEDVTKVKTEDGTNDRTMGWDGMGEEKKNTPQPPKGGAESAISKLLHHLPSGFPEKRKAALVQWLSFKAQKGQGYKGPTGITAWVNLMAPHSDATVQAAVDMAMANNWQGCFPDRVLANQRFAGGKQPPPPAEKKEAPENWQAVALELWPGADLPPEFHQLPDDSQWQVRQAAKNSGGEG